jgi:anti-sigma-K factor RskA
MKCSEFHELAAAFALDALEEDERRACELHLTNEGPHDGCEVVLARHQRAVDALSAVVPSVDVPASLWSTIQLRTGARADSHQRPRKRIAARELAAWTLAAAALLGVAYLGASRQAELSEGDRRLAELRGTSAQLGARVEQSERAFRECESALIALEARHADTPVALSLIGHPDTEVRPMSAASRRPLRATALYNARMRRAFVVSSTLEPVTDKDYELWVIPPGEAPRPAGFIHFRGEIAVGEFDVALLQGAEPAALAVSLEPRGGRPTPSEVVLIAKLRG